MLKLIKYIAINLFCIIIITQNINSTENKILFKVNNEIITSQDILDELKYLEAINKEFKQTNNQQAFEISKNSLIREKIKEIEIKRIAQEIKIDEKILNDLLLNYFKDLGIQSIPEFEKYFLNLNLIPNTIKKKITIELMWNQLIFSKFNQNIKIDKNLIKKDLSKKSRQKEFLISEILFSINENEKLDTKLKLIKKNIEKTSFSQTAITYSISNTSSKGGEVGWIKETSLSNRISTQLKKLKIGEYTKPIIIPGGFLILKIKDVKDVSQNINLDDEIKMVVREKTNQQLNQFSNIYFNKVKKEVQINEL